MDNFISVSRSTPFTGRDLLLKFKFIVGTWYEAEARSILGEVLYEISDGVLTISIWEDEISLYFMKLDEYREFKLKSLG